MHSEGIMAGELKHGPLALVDDSMPVIMIVMRDPVYMVSLIKQVLKCVQEYLYRIIRDEFEIDIETWYIYISLITYFVEMHECTSASYRAGR